MKPLIGTAVIALALPASALANDQLIASDSHVTRVDVVGRNVLYTRFIRNHAPLKRRVMLSIDGKLRRARHIPRRTSATGLGRDGRGRLVVVLVGRGGWWLYDVRRERARRVPGLHARGCSVQNLAVWRARIAFYRFCSNEKRSGVFVRKGKRTRRAARGDANQLTLRGGSLAAILPVIDEYGIYRLMTGGRTCLTESSRRARQRLRLEPDRRRARGQPAPVGDAVGRRRCRLDVHRGHGATEARLRRL
jgi:hypothetical protein